MNNHLLLHFPRTTIAIIEFSDELWGLILDITGPDCNSRSYCPKNILLEGHAVFDSIYDAATAGILICEKLGLDIAFNIIIEKDNSVTGSRETEMATLGDYYNRKNLFSKPTELPLGELPSPVSQQ